MSREVTRKECKTKDRICTDEIRERYKGIVGDRLYRIDISKDLGVRIRVV